MYRMIRYPIGYENYFISTIMMFLTRWPIVIDLEIFIVLKLKIMNFKKRIEEKRIVPGK